MELIKQNNMSESSEIPKKVITKRKLLMGVGAVALGAGIVATGYESMKNTETKIDFSTPSTDYRLLAGTHGNDSMGQWNLVNPLKKSDVPSDTTVFEIETGDLPYLSSEAFPILDRVYTEVAGNVDFFQEPVRLLTERKVPMVLTDIPSTKLNPSLMVDLGFTAAGISLALLQRRETSLTRRKLMLGGALSLLGPVIARNYSGAILNYLQRSLLEPWAQKAAKLNRWVELSNPDDLTKTFRNCIIAAKNLGLEPQFPTSPHTNRPKMLMMYGSGHIVLPEYMKGSKQAILDYLAFYPKPFIDKTFGLDNPHLYTSVVLTPRENGEVRVETVEDKDLKAVFA